MGEVMKKTVLAFCVLSLSLSACSKPKNDSTSGQPSETSAPLTATQPAGSTSETAASLPLADSAETSLDWNGDYEGVLPCADCEGIKTELELNSDKTYELTEEYLGKGKGQETKVKGKFSFDSKEPSIIVLDQAADNRRFFIGEGFAEARAVETGEAITGPLAEHYKLKKQP